MNVLELLRAHVIKISPDATLREMVDVLDLYQVLLLPVVDEDDRLVGAVYEEQVFDCVMGDGADILRDPAQLERVRQSVGGVCAKDIMLSNPTAADEHDDILDTLARMADAGLTRLPVTSSGKVIGTISRVDICQAILEGEL